ncbi:MAG: efflux RND transporter periplasmic adaptor subunit [Planctomycetaceae bacterium]
MSGIDLSQLTIERGAYAPESPPMRRHLLTRYVLPVLLIVGFSGLTVWSAWEMVFPAQRVTVVPVLVTQAEFQHEGTPLFKAAGWVEPRPTPVRVAALAPGVVDELLVVEDQPVKQGEPIAVLVKEDAQLDLEAARANFELREAEWEEAQAMLTAAATRWKYPVHLTAPLSEAEAALAKIETELVRLPFESRKAEAQLAYAKKDYAGKKEAGAAFSERTVDQSISNLETAQAVADELKTRVDSLNKERLASIQRRDALEKQLELLIDEIKAKDAAAARIKAAEARREQARVAVDERELRLKRMTILAPLDGRVYQLIGHPGTTLSDTSSKSELYDSSTVITMYRPDRLQVRVDVRFEDLPHVTLGQPVQIDNPALPETLSGRVLFISSVADIQKNTLQVKVEFESTIHVLKPEMLVDVTFLAPPSAGEKPSSTRSLKILVPQDFVRTNDGGPFVWIVDPSSDTARIASVKTGIVTVDGMIEVTRGLTIASRLIAGGAESLEDGERVRVAGEDETFVASQRIPSRRPSSPMNRLPQGEK